MTVRQWIARTIGVLVLLALVLAPGRALAQQGTLSNLVIAGLSPQFDPAITQYTMPKSSTCIAAVTATLANPAHSLYIANSQAVSGVTKQSWTCSGSSFSIVIYKGWTEVGRYTVTPIDAPPPPPPPPPPALSALTAPGLSPAFAPGITEYTAPRTGCTLTVGAALATPTNKLYIQSAEVPSGGTRQAWVCDGHASVPVVIYKGWTEIARYTITMVDPPPPPPPPAPEPTPDPDPVDNPEPTDPMMPPPPAPAPPPYVPPPTAPGEPAPTASPAPVFNEPMPPMSAVNAATAQLFLRQATFGPDPASMAALQSQGPDYWLWQQMQLAASPVDDGLDINGIRAQVFQNMVNGNDQLRQRMMFALSQILVVSANKIVNGYEMIPWVRMLSTHAFGNYRTLLREVTLSPTMGKYLDLANSVGGAASVAPNENYPREILQLFSLGIWQLEQDGTLTVDGQGNPIPVYDQNTIREVARALSGWTYPTAPGQPYRSRNNEYFEGLMEPRPENHDTGAKTILGHTIPAGQTVTKDMNDVLDIIFSHPNVPPFVATRLIRSLVTSNPSPAYIARVAGVFADDGNGVRGNLAAVLKAVLLDPEAIGTGPTDGRLVDPVLEIMGLARALGVQVGDPGQFLYVFRQLGQEVLTPTSVFSFYSPLAPMPGHPDLFGPEFSLYAPALAILRANFIYGLLSGQFGSVFPVDLAPFKAQANNPAALVELVNQTLLQGQMSTDLRATLVAATQATSDPTQRALGALYLTALSSEFRVHAAPVQ
ncbi:MAG: DUF1800 family protein [Vicinamibacterales bacterium]